MESDEVVLPSTQPAIDTVKLLEKYLLFHEDGPKLIKDIVHIYRKTQKKYWESQKKLTDYFK